jgi:hypothetical protein
MKNHAKCGWGCECWYVFGLLLWVAAIIALVYAWVATVRGSILGEQAEFWFWNALILGVLAVPLRARSGNGTCGSCGGSGCEVCKR